VVNQLSMILEDGIITEQEGQDLMLDVNQTAGNVVDEETVGYEFSKQVWEDSEQKLAGHQPWPEN
jgi:hypothetical protein